MNPTALIPHGVLGDEFDKLLDERARLEDALPPAVRAKDAAEKAVRPAIEKDRIAYAEALRDPKATKPPGTQHRDGAQAALDQAERHTFGLREALRLNGEAFIVLLDEQRQQMTSTLAENEQQHRTLAMSLLQQLSTALLDFQKATALRRWVEEPTVQSGGLRAFNPKPLAVKIDHLRRVDSAFVSAQSVVDTIGARLEGGQPDIELRAAAAEAGVRFDEIQRHDAGAITFVWGSGAARKKVSILDIRQRNLVKLVILRGVGSGRVGVELPIAREVLELTSLTDYLREAKPAIEQAFTQQKRVVTACDEVTQGIIDSLVDDPNKNNDRRRAAELDDKQAEAQPEPVPA